MGSKNKKKKNANANAKPGNGSSTGLKSASPSGPVGAGSGGAVSKRTTGLSAFQKKMEDKLKGSKFRWLNEQLYTSVSDKAFSLFTEQPELFDVYHEGFRQQVSKWPVNPLDLIIGDIKRSVPQQSIIGDFGCGEGRLAISVPHKVHSFDLVAGAPHVVACDIANVPLEDQSLDIAVFCLSLMGTNWLEFINESNRVLKPNGVLKIAEVTSRIPDVEKFIGTLKTMNFHLIRKDQKNTHFVFLEFKKKVDANDGDSAASAGQGKKKSGKSVDSSKRPSGTDIMKPCIYKKR